jgi:hypothetical protein
MASSITSSRPASCERCRELADVVRVSRNHDRKFGWNACGDDTRVSDRRGTRLGGIKDATDVLGKRLIGDEYSNLFTP